MPPGQVHLRITDVLTAVPAGAGVEAGMVVLTEDDPPGRSLRIIIGQPEARAIMSAWQGAAPGRSSTWDLFVSTVAILGGRIERAVITAVQEERHYFALLELEQSGEHRSLSCRPSDAVALAIRAYNAGIFAEESVLAEAGVLPDGTKPVKEDEPVPAPVVTEREAALAAKEAELAARERALLAREAGRPADPAVYAARPEEPAVPADASAASAAPTDTAAAPEVE
ncbi:MAG: bifunctional nuclease family protein [Actinomycetota bacterium]|nr:bifunctional nuclease family protein [Actinomycetota bacterium]